MNTLALIALSSYVLCGFGGLATGRNLFDASNVDRILDGHGLYPEGEAVIVLTAKTLEHRMAATADTIWVVEFYSAWCGYCQRFALLWRSLAFDAAPWGDLVKIAALDCANDANSDICRQYNIMAYPTIRYFRENFKPLPAPSHTIGTNLTKGETVYVQSEILVEHFIKEQRSNHARTLPNLLEDTTSATCDQVFNGDTDAKYAFLLVGHQDTVQIVAAQVALDFHKTPEILIRYVAPSNAKLLVALHATNTTSLMYAVNRLNTSHAVVVSADVTNRTSVQQALIKFLHSTTNATIRIVADLNKSKELLFTGAWADADIPDIADLFQQKEQLKFVQGIKQLGDVVFQGDLETALRLQFKEIARFQELSLTQNTVLVQYFQVLIKYFPFGASGRQFLAHVVDQLKATTPTKLMTGVDFERITADNITTDAGVFSTQLRWYGCRGSKHYLRGYPCGLWTLFHYLTVAADDATYPSEVLNVVYDYVSHFFGCEDCRNHFRHMAGQLKLHSSVHSLDAAVLWLWTAHNRVNRRLANDTVSDPVFPKVQFPTAERCPQCRRIGHSAAAKIDQIVWNQPFVLTYLRHMYARSSLHYNGANVDVLDLPPQASAETLRSGGGGFRPFDLVMCLMLYVCSFVFIMLLIRIFLKRGYRKKLYIHDILGKV